LATSRPASDGATADEKPRCESYCLGQNADAVVQGLAVRATEGASRCSLHRVVDMAMQVCDCPRAA
jgi:hypothetical protein